MAVTAKVRGWGAGASGSVSSAPRQATGGGGGALSQLNAFVLSSGTGYPVTIGLGGASVTGNTVNIDGNAGGDTNFVNSSTLLAKGGNAGRTTTNGVTPQNGGTGGDSAAGVGDVKFSGGHGGNNTNNTSNQTGGGGAAGDANNGGNGTSDSTSAGAGGATGGGNGSNGANGTSGNATAPGGGSGGASVGSGTVTSGNGADGKLQILVAQGLITSATGGTFSNDGTNDIWTFTASGTWTPTFSAAGGGFLLNFI